MKNLGLALMGLLMISSTGAFAQMSFGVKAGLNLSNMTLKAGGEKMDDIKFKPGFNVGAFADFELSDLLSVEAGMNIETKGYLMKEKYEEYGFKVKTKNTANLVYVTIPVDAKLTFGSFYVLAGPYVGIAAAGKVKSKMETDSHTDKHDDSLDFGSDKKDDLKRLDLGLGLGAGYEINDNLGVRLGYDLGLSNLTPEGDKDNSSKNGSINISATYKF